MYNHEFYIVSQCFTLSTQHCIIKCLILFTPSTNYISISIMYAWSLRYYSSQIAHHSPLVLVLSRHQEIRRLNKCNMTSSAFFSLINICCFVCFSLTIQYTSLCARTRFNICPTNKQI